MIGLLTNRFAIGAALLVALGVGVFLYGRMQYREGVRDTTSQFVKADKEGAENVRKTAEKALAGIGDDTDVDSLLRNTGGLRD